MLVSWAVARIDKYEREAWWAVAACFALGGALTAPAVHLEKMLYEHVENTRPALVYLLLFAFVVVALVEEGFKSAALLLGPYPRRFFNEPLDGIVYAVAIAMGFAAFENLVYADRYDWQTLLLRAFTAVPAHLVFAIVQGYYAGKARFAPPPRRRRLLATGFAQALLLHGTYDFLVLQRWTEWLVALASVGLYLSLFYFSDMIREHQENSPFKP
jgi:RsiW-degrading membrane proteinase PrsW (M82 family)